MSNLTKNTKLNAWLDEMIALTNPANVVLIDGTDEQAEALRAEACASGELFKLNQEKLPGCYLHRTAVNDVARVENRTFICTTKKEDAGPTNNWMSPKECYDKLTPLFRNSYAGKTMYVIPYSMGVVGSPFAKNGIELTDSIYVVLNMLIMTRVGTDVLDAMGTDGDFIKGLHARATMDENNRYICHFPEDNTIWSVNSGYGGNVLLGKKCFALRIASYLGRNEGWMAEHMLILGIENPEGEIKYIAAAFPSACGKTNLAMLIPPELYSKKGYKVWCVGDDIAWIRKGPDGRLWAANPENGFFGVAPGTNAKSTRTRWPPREPTPSSQTSYSTRTTTPSGGRVWTKIRRSTHSTGRESRGTARPAPRRARIPTPALLRLPSSAPASPRSLTILPASPFPQLFSAAEEPRPHRWFISPSTGSMVPSSARSWLRRRPLPQPVPSAWSEEIRWRCCPSADTTWASTSRTG